MRSRVNRAGAAGDPRAGAPRAAGGVRVGAAEISLPSPNGPAAERVVREALGRVAERLPTGLSGSFGHLDLRVQPRAEGEGPMIDAITEALLAALQRHGGDRDA